MARRFDVGTMAEALDRLASAAIGAAPGEPEQGAWLRHGDQPILAVDRRMRYFRN